MSATAPKTDIKERPILFSGPMVRAILEGRKTQTRRVITNERVKAFAPGYADDRERILGMCPHGRVGDHLWVRETWAPHDAAALSNKEPEYIYYRADDEAKYETDGTWRPSIFMPRWASRITLEITNVRVERLQEISESDARAEGMRRHDASRVWSTGADLSCFASAKEAFAHGWNSINAKRGHSWDSNPFVWVIAFKKL